MITTPHYDVFLFHNGAGQADVATIADALRTQGHLPTSKTSKAWRADPGISCPKTRQIIRLKANG